MFQFLGNLSSALQAVKQPKKSQTYVYFLTIKWYLYQRNWFCMIYLSVLLLDQPHFSIGEQGVDVCLCVRDRYRGPFSGIPDKDEEGSWIQAASVSRPERHPAVA